MCFDFECIRQNLAGYFTQDEEGTPDFNDRNIECDLNSALTQVCLCCLHRHTCNPITQDLNRMMIAHPNLVGGFIFLAWHSNLNN